jgi:para-aminobenzoate synthetase
VLTLLDILTAMPSLRRLDFLPDPERAFVHVFGSSRNAFWLDGLGIGERARFSFMGDAGGPLGAVATYDVAAGEVRVEEAGQVERHGGSIFDFLDQELGRLQMAASDRGGDLAGLPFGFDCGFVGYLGYELKADCGAAAAHRADNADAALIRAGRLIAFDHLERRCYLLSLTDADSWVEEIAERLLAMAPLEDPVVAPLAEELVLRRSGERYREDIAACQRYLAAGHSYEICLTDKVTAETAAEPLDLYRRLRRVNPAPFSAFLRFEDLAVLSSSPERFLAIDDAGRAEARPIKGTARRGSTPAEDTALADRLRRDEKSRAENVTIVDLMRNDLGRVCEPGSVEVAELMRVESYETVHQLVSGVRGRLLAGLTAVDAVRACFPPGSMTGAPKLRTMEILDELEGEARGVYSGAIGWFGRGGACDLSVAIRTIVLDKDTATIGAGGAIVVDSDPEEEIAEMLLKVGAAATAFGAETPLLGRT